MNSYTYKIVDDQYLEMGGEPYEYGETELVTFVANEIKIALFDFAIPIVRSQSDDKNWEYLHRRLRCRIFEDTKLLSVFFVDRDGQLAGDDGGGWEAANEFDKTIDAAAEKTFSPEYLKVLEDVRTGKRAAPEKPSAEAIARARVRVGYVPDSKVESITKVRSANGRKKI